MLKNKENEKTRIYIDEERMEVVGYTPTLLALYSTLTKYLSQNLKGATKEDLEKAFTFAFASEKEIVNELLNKIKEFSKKLEDKEE